MIFIPFTTLRKVLAATSQEFESVAGHLGLVTVVHESVDEQDGTIEKCYAKKEFAEFKLCKRTSLATVARPKSSKAPPPMASILANNTTTRIEDYDRIFHSNQCRNKRVEKILLGESLQCDYGSVHLSIQKSYYDANRIGYQVYIEAK